MEKISYEEFVEILMERAKENEIKSKMLVFDKSGHKWKKHQDIPYEQGKHAYEKEMI